MATVEDVFTPEGSGLAIISTGGLLSFSKTVQVQLAPWPPGSKSTGAFWAKAVVVANTPANSSCSAFIISKLVWLKVHIVF